VAKVAQKIKFSSQKRLNNAHQITYFAKAKT